MAAAGVAADERIPAADVLLGRVRIGRRGRSPRGSAETARVASLPIAVAANRSDAMILNPARPHDATPYDAADLDMALGLGLPLATLDRAPAARARGVTLLGPLAP